jgi:hypothetical protein
MLLASGHSLDQIIKETSSTFCQSSLPTRLLDMLAAITSIWSKWDGVAFISFWVRYPGKESLQRCLENAISQVAIQQLAFGSKPRCTRLASSKSVSKPGCAVLLIAI